MNLLHRLYLKSRLLLLYLKFRLNPILLKCLNYRQLLKFLKFRLNPLHRLCLKSRLLLLCLKFHLGPNQQSLQHAHLGTQGVIDPKLVESAGNRVAFGVEGIPNELASRSKAL